MLKAKHGLIAAIFVISYSFEFSNIKSTDPPELFQLANKTYADLALENMRLKLYQELGFENDWYRHRVFQIRSLGII